MTANGAAVPLSVIAGMRKFAMGAGLLLLSFMSGAQEPPLPIFDAHIHYSHDAWESVPPQQAIEILRKAGVRRALVSSSGDDGQQKLYALAPDLILPSLRPYRSRGDIGTWVRDQSVIPYLEERLKRYRYVAIGEFHVFGADADLPVVRRVVSSRSSTGSSCTRIPTPTPSSAISSRTPRHASCGRTRASTGPSACARCCASTRTCGAISRGAPTTRRGASSIRTGAPPCSSFPTASWSAPTRPRPSAGTT